MVNRSEACKGAPSASPRVIDEAASTALLDEKHWLRVLRDLRKMKDVG